jgi:hypothetical protein
MTEKRKKNDEKKKVIKVNGRQSVIMTIGKLLRA